MIRRTLPAESRAWASGWSCITVALVLASCGAESQAPTGAVASAGPTTGAGGASGTSSSTSTGPTSGVGGAGPEDLQGLLARLRSNRDKTLLDESNLGGWPVKVVEGRVVVSVVPTYHQVAGDFDAWAGTELTKDQGFAWGLMPDNPGDRYKLTTGQVFEADPWSRGYAYDQNGELSMLPSAAAHLERFFQVKSTMVEPRTVRVWLPSGAPARVLYAEDGQNLFDPAAAWGGWHLSDNAPADMMIVGVDNSPARLDEYTHVPDVISGNTPVGGQGDAYGELLETVVRPLVQLHYGEPAKRGLLGSSLGGLISLHVANRYPGEYAFAASLSGTLGWGSIGVGIHNETMMDRYALAGHASSVVYRVSGGIVSTCVDSDADGVDDDDPANADNYCETIQMRDLLASLGYQFNVDLFHWHEVNAIHNEAAWAARVFRPIQIFDAL